jgi:glycosyltransferase involved in cell wall biosynthesis
VITVHGLHSIRRSNTRPIRFLNRRVLRRAGAVMVLGDSDRRAIASADLVSEHRIRVIHAGFAPWRIPDRAAAREAFALPPASTVVLWLGRLSAEKDPVSFVEALAWVADPGVIGLVAGDGESAPELATRVRSLGLGSRVRLLGWLADPGAALGAADLFVGTSRWEGFPIAALEAAAAGLALVLSDVPGNRDLAAAGVPAVLVPPASAERLASAIEELAADADRRRGLGRKGAEVVRSTFTPQALAADVLAVYEDVARPRLAR